MKRYIEALCLLTVCLILNASCLGSDDDSKVEYANDTAIKTFSLTTVNRYVHTTTKAGKDSVYKKALINPPKTDNNYFSRVTLFCIIF